MMKMDCRAGYNMKNDSTSSSSTSEYSFLFEQRMFELKIGNYEEYLENGMTFTKISSHKLKSYQARMTKVIPIAQDQFEKFFDRFGHFLVSSGVCRRNSRSKMHRKM